MLTEDFPGPTTPLSPSKAGVRGQLSRHGRHPLPGLALFRARHRELARTLDAGPQAHCVTRPRPDVDAECRARQAWAQGGWLRHAVGGKAHGGAQESIDTRAICLIRETLARHSGLADFAFAMQGLGSGAISLPAPRRAEAALPAARGPARPSAPLPVRARRRLRRGGDGLRRPRRWRPLWCWTAKRPGSPTAASPTSTWSSPAPARPRRAGHQRLHRRGRHPRFRDCRAHRRDRPAPAGAPALHQLPHSLVTQRVGAAGEGFKVAMRTLDVFRTSVAGGALGFARRAMDERCSAPPPARCSGRAGRLSAHPGQAGADGHHHRQRRLLTYRAAWQRDQGHNVTREAAMAKMTATENAQQVIDAAVQIWGGLGVVSGSRWSACTARSARCASTKARPKCSSSSLRVTCWGAPRLPLISCLSSKCFTTEVFRTDVTEQRSPHHAQRPCRHLCADHLPPPTSSPSSCSSCPSCSFPRS
jgi:acyl-CoA dehydrogenase